MRNIVPLILLVFVSSCANAQKPTPTPEPTPNDPNLQHVATITGISYSLKNLPEIKDSFKAKEDSFLIRLPPVTEPYRPAQFPQGGGEPKAGRALWKMQEATIAISISPLPPGLIGSWSKTEYVEELKQSIEAAISNANGQRIYEKDIKVGDLVGREAKVTAQGVTLLTRVFFANDRQYVVAAQLGRDANAESLAKAALDTFELIVQ